MHRIRSAALAAATVASIGIAVFTFSATGTSAPGAAPFAACVEHDPTVPILMYETAGFSLGGSIHQRLTVYSTGLASWSEAGGGVFTPEASQAKFVGVPEADIKQLAKDLRSANAMSLCDIQEFVSDVPPTHVTVFQGSGADLHAHTYSYFLASTPQHAKVQNIVQAFIAKWFPPNPLGG